MYSYRHTFIFLDIHQFIHILSFTFFFTTLRPHRAQTSGLPQPASFSAKRSRQPLAAQPASGDDRGAGERRSPQALAMFVCLMDNIRAARHRTGASFSAHKKWQAQTSFKERLSLSITIDRLI